jgi:hypothetical protein
MIGKEAAMIGNVLIKEEANYIEGILKACNDAIPLKTYTVVREDTFEQLKKAIDYLVERNPLYELASKPLNLQFLQVNKWIAVLVEYDDQTV